MIPVSYMRKKGFGTYLDESFMPCVTPVEIVGIADNGRDWELIGDTGKEPLRMKPDDLCETLEEGFVLSIKKYQNWN